MSATAQETEPEVASVTEAAADTAEPSAAVEVDNATRLVLYDGVCGLCSRTVRFLLKIDNNQALTFAPLQGETAAALRTVYPNIPEQLDSFVFVHDGKASLRSRAFVRLARHLRYPWKAASWLWIIPAPLLDVFYRLIAATRYKLFGKFDSCQLPSPEQRERFLP